MSEGEVSELKTFTTLQRLGDIRGFTLVETVLSWIILGIIAFTIATMLGTGVEHFENMSSRKEALSSARLAIDRMRQELLQVKSEDLISLSVSNISFKDKSGNNTDFHVQSTAGELQLFRGGDLLAKGLAGFNLIYYDQAGNVMVDLSDPSQVRRIRIHVSVSSADGNASYVLNGEVYPRSMYYENFEG